MKPLRRVFSIVADCHAETGHYRALWRRHFYEGLKRQSERFFFPEGISFDWARTGKDGTAVLASRSRASDLLWQQIRAAHGGQGLDAVVSYCYSGDVELELVKRTIKMGVPWINFFCDSTHRFAMVESLARVVSLNWFPERGAVPLYQAVGTPFVCLPYAVNPDYLPELSVKRPRYSLSFIGLPTTNRITQLGLLLLFRCPVEIRGHGWVEPAANPFVNPTPLLTRVLKGLLKPGLAEKAARRLMWPMVRRRAMGPLDDSEFEDFLRESQLVLGLNQGCDEYGRRASYLKFRDIEFPGYGCCYLSEHNEDIENAFVVGQEVLTYRSMLNAVRIVRQETRHLERVLRIGLAGRRRVLADHTWEVRLNQLAARL